MSEPTRPAIVTKPEAAIRALFTNTGEVTVQVIDMTDGRIVTQLGTLLTHDLTTIVFHAGVAEGSFAALMYTVECWMEIYPLQMMEALGRADPFVLDPGPLPHPTAGRRDIAANKEVSFVVTKSGLDDVVTIRATRPNSVTELTVDAGRPAVSVALLAEPHQKCYVRFENWPGEKEGKTFVYPKPA